MGYTATLITNEAGADAPIVHAVTSAVAATGVEVDWDRHVVSDWSNLEPVVAALKATGTGLMPYVPVDRQAGELAPIVSLRKELGVFANIRPMHSLPHLSSRFTDVDLVVVRETTEDVYAKLEHQTVAGTFESLKVTTEAACERIARFGFEFAKKQGRKKVTIAHKANIMKKSDGMFLRTAQRVAKEYPEIEAEDCIVDALCMKLILHPEWYDVLLCGNLFGDIVADLSSGLVGGRANCPSVNVADGVEIYTAGHGDGEDLAYGDEANPTSLLFSAVVMLRRWDEQDAAEALMQAITDTLDAGIVPIAAGGDTTTTAFGEAVCARLG